MKKQLLLLCCCFTLLLACNKGVREESQTASGSPVQQQKEIPFCGVKDVGLAGLRSHRAASVLSASNDFVLYISIKGGRYQGGLWGAAFNYTTSVGAGMIAAADTLGIFEQIREDYSPWKITVTTDSNLYNSHTVGNRTKAIVAPNLTSVINQGVVGGLSLIQSILPGFEEPCIIFPDNLSYSLNKVQEAISHECGHTLGLYHQADITGCTLNNAYWTGQGTGATSWAPIMGLPYNKGITTWAQGLTSNFNSSHNCYDILQDELAFIATEVNYVTETNYAFEGLQLTGGGFFSSVPINNTPFTRYIGYGPATGHIDQDVFYIPYFAGNKTLNVTTYGDLDVQVTIYYWNEATPYYTFDDVGGTGVTSASFSLPHPAETTNNTRQIMIRATPNNANVPLPIYMRGKYTLTIN